MYVWNIYIYTVYIMTILTTERTNQNSKKLLCLLLRCPTRRSVKDVPGNIRVGTRHCWSPTGAPSKVLTTGEGDGNDIKLWCDLQHPKQPWSRQLRILRADPNLPFVGLASSWFWDMSADMRTKIIRTQRVTPAPHFAVEVSGHRVAPRTNSRHLRPVVAESIGPPGGDSAVLRYRHPPGQNLQNGTFTYRTKLGIVDKMLNIYWTCNCSIYIYIYIYVYMYM